ncbi:MAG: hypothetical protein ACRD5F_09475 [Candidatus Acidiferrales bacterium]
MTMAKHKKTRAASREERLLLAAIDQLQSFEHGMAERLSRVEENLRLLRRDLLGNGQPGRLGRLEAEMDLMRAESQRQRGVLAGISFIVSTAIALLAQLFFN